MRCPLCDGPVVNGRCKDCGMPYRKDEILYHLNESRDDHYRHASDKARRIMQNQQKAGAGTRPNNSRTVTKRAVQEQQKKIRQEAMQKMAAAGNTARTTYGNRNTKRMPGQKSGRKKSSRIGLIIAILTILAVVAPMTDNLFDVIDDLKYKNSYKSSYTEPADTTIDTEAYTDNSDTYFYGWQDDDGYNYYSIAAGYGQAVTGDQIEAGKYGIYTTSDQVIMTVNDKEYTLKSGDDTLFLTLKDGDIITVESEESDYDSVYLMEWED